MASNVAIRGLYMLTTALQQQDVQQIMSGVFVGFFLQFFQVFLVCFHLFTIFRVIFVVFEFSSFQVTPFSLRRFF